MILFLCLELVGILDYRMGTCGFRYYKSSSNCVIQSILTAFDGFREHFDDVLNVYFNH